MHFLTAIDPRAAIKGSRDPLGLQPIWTSLGRKLVGNLTTVTTSTRGFTTLILGLYFADELTSAGVVGEADRAAVFISSSSSPGVMPRALRRASAVPQRRQAHLA